MAKCGDCLHFQKCSHYVTSEETFPEVGGCSAFKNKGDFVEVVRCKDCKHWIKSDNGISWQMIGRTDGTCKRLLDIHYAERYMTEGDHFCDYGERREGE